MSLQRLTEQFLQEGQARGWEPATCHQYRYFFDLIHTLLARQGCARYPDVTAADLQGVVQGLTSAGYARKTIVGTVILARRFFAWLHAEGHILLNIAQALPLSNDGEEELPEPPLSEGEVTAIFDSLPRNSETDLRGVCLLEFLYGSGLRISEALGLTLSDIQPGALTLTVRDSKHGQSRVVPMTKTAAATLKAYLAIRPQRSEPRIFQTIHGTPWRLGSVYAWFKAWNISRGPELRHLHPHLFRHAIAVHLLRGGADIRYIQAFLGHAHLDTTKIYLLLVPGHLQADYDRAMPYVAVPPCPATLPAGTSV